MNRATARSAVRRPRFSGGFTIMEMMAALSLLLVAVVIVTQVSLWSLDERTRSVRRHAAQELAINSLEAARLRAWDALTSEWATTQKLPEPYVEEGWKLTVRVEPEAGRPRTKRVTVEVNWQPVAGAPARIERLVAWFSARTGPARGGKS